MYSKTDVFRADVHLPVLLDTLSARLAAVGEVRRWVIALSGGLDSSVLLELCSRLPLAQPRVAVHINHQLQSAADAWPLHCQRHCERLAVPLTVIPVQPASASEASARAARYAAFADFLQPGDCLLLAQHADDQAETLLLRLLRGAGVTGLAGMPVARPLGQAQLLRPLLEQPRALLEAVATELGLQPVIDPTNAQDHYDRNWLRLHILPRLQQHWPGLLNRCGDTVELMRDADALLRERAEEDLQACGVATAVLDLNRLQQLSPERQRNLMHHWISAATGVRLSRRRLIGLMHAMVSAGAGADPVERLQSMQLRRYRHELYLLPDPLPAPLSMAVPVRVGQVQELPHGRLSWQRAAQGLADGHALTLDYRRGGERLRPLGRGGSVALKQVLQESGMPPWLRSLQPLLKDGERIVALPGLCLCADAVVENGFVPQWDAFGLS
ncbi:tRNA(Ile)-lysidine synthase [Marinobacterium halophilum]|uniref:tRNA(Ile)-lysidine synthase n=1 Tax=Marinobacterium halophilum TaxID=267374 RepID=A0A2P8ER57_9GAMM|nr:tRNA lysidine(34) synthetase TilS [Marinobacterium halophilum]PSL11957.1 tRNA(Ile)-lysidine synthase [Marinobacterium halophilum]